MMQLNDIKNDQVLLDAIDWDMTPEEAVRLYLEWGNNWASGNYVIRGKDDSTQYFVVYSWEDKPYVLLISRNSDEAKELAKISLPAELQNDFLESTSYNKGVYAVDGKVRAWLENELYNV